MPDENKAGEERAQTEDGAVAPAKYPFALFISYSSQDAKVRVAGKSLNVVRELKRSLESHSTAERGRFRVCSFEEDFELSDTVAEAIREKLLQSENLLVICSTAASGSKYVIKELEQFKDFHPNSDLIPAQLDMLPEAAFPAFFSADSLGADLIVRPGESTREWKQRVEDESHKIVSRAWNLPIKAVYDRFSRQRRRRRRLVLGAALALLLLIGLSSWQFRENRLAKKHADATRALETAGFDVVDRTVEKGYASYEVVFSPSEDERAARSNEEPEYVRRVQKSLPHLNNLLSIESLSISGVEVGDEWLAEIGQLSGLQKLSITDSAITDNGLIHLTTLSDVLVLDLRETKVTDAGIDELGVDASETTFSYACRALNLTRKKRR